MARIIQIPIWIEDSDSEITGPLVFRMDGRVEWVCKHGTGHTIAVQPLLFSFESWKGSWGTHGCDGCCAT